MHAQRRQVRGMMVTFAAAQKRLARLVGTSYRITAVPDIKMSVAAQSPS